MMGKGRAMLILTLILSNIAWLVFHLATRLDHGVTLTYQEASLAQSNKMLEQVLVIANHNLIGKSLGAVKDELSIDNDGHEAFVKGRCLYANGLCLEFDQNDIIVSVGPE